MSLSINDWIVTNKMIKKIDDDLLSNDNTIFFDEDSGSVIFSSVDVNNINHDDNNFNEDDAKTIKTAKNKYIFFNDEK